MDLPAHLAARVEELAPGPGPLLVAVSGGADSVALLRGLLAAGFEVSAAHLDHGLRLESRVDAAFVSDLAERHGIELRLERVDVARVAKERGWNLEDAGRRVRYEFLTRSAKVSRARAVVTGHTLDDQAETVMMQLLRGSAYPRGMPPRHGLVVRPLLEIRRQELREWLSVLGQDWREDASNQDATRTRAWLRSEVLPLLESRAPKFSQRLARLARVQGDVADLLESKARGLERSGAFDRLELLAAHPALQREALRLLFERAGVAPDAERIEEVRRQLNRKTPYRRTLARGVCLRVAYGRVEVAREGAAALQPRRVENALQLPAGVPERALEFPDLMLRGRLPGDRMRLPGGEKSLARVLIDHKIPREERGSIRVLASGRRVLWAEGVGLAAELRAGRPSARDKDETFMARTLELAKEGAAAGELPVGALVIREGEVVGEAHNETESSGDPTAHAEILALRRAARRIDDWRLTGCTLYVTLEPCPMCAGAALEAHLARVVFGAPNRRDGALGSVTDLQRAPWKRTIEVRGGVLARPAAKLLSDFFAGRRQR